MSENCHIGILPHAPPNANNMVQATVELTRLESDNTNFIPLRGRFEGEPKNASFLILKQTRNRSSHYRLKILYLRKP